jgi:hypothetical protein
MYQDLFREQEQNARQHRSARTLVRVFVARRTAGEHVNVSFSRTQNVSSTMQDNRLACKSDAAKGRQVYDVRLGRKVLMQPTISRNRRGPEKSQQLSNVIIISLYCLDSGPSVKMRTAAPFARVPILPGG